MKFYETYQLTLNEVGLYVGTMVSTNVAELTFVGVRFRHFKSKWLRHSPLRSLSHGSRELGGLLLKWLISLGKHMF